MKSFELTPHQQACLDEVTKDLTPKGKKHVLKAVQGAWSSDESARARSIATRERHAAALEARRNNAKGVDCRPRYTIPWDTRESTLVLTILSTLVIRRILKEREAAALEIYNGLRDGNGYTMKAVGALIDPPVGPEITRFGMVTAYFKIAINHTEAAVPGSWEALRIIKRVHGCLTNTRLIDEAIQQAGESARRRSAGEVL